MTIQIPAWFGFGETTLICGSALVFGSRDEQLAAGGLLLGWVATLLFRDNSWAGTQWAGLTVDALFLALLVYIALRSLKYWPIAAAAFQLLGVITHAAHMVDPQVAPWAYATAGVIWTQLVLISLATGAWNSWRSRHQLASAGDPPDNTPGATRR